MPDLVRIRRALLSVSDKADLVPFARALVSHRVEIISTGGTAKALADAGVPVIPIEKVTGFPEMMGGRVKTLHPKVHGGLLAVRDDPDHAAAMKAHGIEAIDLVCVSLYPFAKTIARPGVEHHEAIEQIDIGGPAMIRSGAKNFGYVTVVTSPRQYDRVINELAAHDGHTRHAMRAELAAAAFGHTSEYDTAIATYLGRIGPEAFPEVLRLGYVKADELRYGENPHQAAALYRNPAHTGPSIVTAQQLHGKQLSYNNINDAAAALELVRAFAQLDAARAGACVIKHANPCGAAIAVTPAGAVDQALAGDPVAAYGGILALNRVLDAAAAERLVRPDIFLEVIVAPAFEPAALDALRQRWVNVRLLEVGEGEGPNWRRMEYRSVPGGMLVQDRDVLPAATVQWQHVAGPKPTPQQLHSAAFLETVVRFLWSNAIVIGGPTETGDGHRMYGAGCGQMDRVTSCRLAVEKAGAKARGAVAVGDAFFPFPDGPKILLDSGVTMIVHPGGSKRDQESIDLCAGRNATCVTTGVRRFKH